ncbi:MAG: hypothetical protein M3Q73_01125 [bacterium]|nr:hypothetical protein [bacterium]
MKSVLLSSLLITTLFFSIPLSTFAQSIDGLRNPIEDRLSITIFPQIPKPGQTITVEVRSSTLALERATISWFVNNKAFQSGVGLTKIESKTGVSGSSSTFRAVVSLDGEKYEKSRRISPASVDLIWQARSYTPPMYKGKALFPYQGEVTVVAMPDMVENGVRLSSKNLIYTWKANGTRLKDSGGVGKNSITVESDVIVRPIELSVEVLSISGRTAASQSIVLEYTEPEVILYEDNPLYGPLYHQSLGGSINLQNQEIWIKAAPYYFSTTNHHADNTVAFDWNINSGSTGQRQSTIILRHAGEQSGQSVLSVKTTSPNRVMQSSASSLTINFNSQ